MKEVRLDHIDVTPILCRSKLESRHMLINGIIGFGKVKMFVLGDEINGPNGEWTGKDDVIFRYLLCSSRGYNCDQDVHWHKKVKNPAQKRKTEKKHEAHEIMLTEKNAVECDMPTKLCPRPSHYHIDEGRTVKARMMAMGEAVDEECDEETASSHFSEMNPMHEDLVFADGETFIIENAAQEEYRKVGKVSKRKVENLDSETMVQHSVKKAAVPTGDYHHQAVNAFRMYISNTVDALGSNKKDKRACKFYRRLMSAGVHTDITMDPTLLWMKEGKNSRFCTMLNNKYVAMCHSFGVDPMCVIDVDKWHRVMNRNGFHRGPGKLSPEELSGLFKWNMKRLDGLQKDTPEAVEADNKSRAKMPKSIPDQFDEMEFVKMEAEPKGVVAIETGVQAEEQSMSQESIIADIHALIQRLDEEMMSEVSEVTDDCAYMCEAAEPPLLFVEEKEGESEISESEWDAFVSKVRMERGAIRKGSFDIDGYEPSTRTFGTIHNTNSTVYSTIQSEWCLDCKPFKPPRKKVTAPPPKPAKRQKLDTIDEVESEHSVVEVNPEVEMERENILQRHDEIVNDVVEQGIVPHVELDYKVDDYPMSVLVYLNLEEMRTEVTSLWNTILNVMLWTTTKKFTFTMSGLEDSELIQPGEIQPILYVDRTASRERNWFGRLKDRFLRDTLWLGMVGYRTPAVDNKNYRVNGPIKADISAGIYSHRTVAIVWHNLADALMKQAMVYEAASVKTGETNTWNTGRLKQLVLTMDPEYFSLLNAQRTCYTIVYVMNQMAKAHPLVHASDPKYKMKFTSLY